MISSSLPLPLPLPLLELSCCGALVARVRSQPQLITADVLTAESDSNDGRPTPTSSHVHVQSPAGHGRCRTIGHRFGSEGTDTAAKSSNRRCQAGNAAAFSAIEKAATCWYIGSPPQRPGVTRRAPRRLGAVPWRKRAPLATSIPPAVFAPAECTRLVATRVPGQPHSALPPREDSLVLRHRVRPWLGRRRHPHATPLTRTYWTGVCRRENGTGSSDNHPKDN